MYHYIYNKPRIYAALAVKKRSTLRFLALYITIFEVNLEYMLHSL